METNSDILSPEATLEFLVLSSGSASRGTIHPNVPDIRDGMGPSFKAIDSGVIVEFYGTEEP